jgi:hypothetical protein
MEGDHMRMDRRSISIMTRRAILLAVGTTVLPTAIHADPTLAGVVERIRGEGYVDGAERRTLTATAPVFVGDLVCTGNESRIDLKLGTRTRIKLGADARLKIDRFLVNAGGELILERGAMRAEFQTDEGSALSVKSPFALLAVRGTQFFAGPIDGFFGVFVERGVVAVTGGARTVTLLAETGTTIRWAGAEPRSPARWNPGRIRRALASVD